MRRIATAIFLSLLAGTCLVGLTGTGVAHAATDQCDNEPYPEDIAYTVEGNGPISTIRVGLDRTVAPPSVIGVWVCQRDDNQWRYVGAGLHDPDPGRTGWTVELLTCDATACGYNLAPTGVETSTPNTGTSGGLPGSTASASAASGDTCYAVNGSPSCPGSLELATVTFVVPNVQTSGSVPSGGCTGVAGWCAPPLAVSVGSDSGPVLAVDVLGVYREQYLAKTCVLQVNRVC